MRKMFELIDKFHFLTVKIIPGGLANISSLIKLIKLDTFQNAITKSDFMFAVAQTVGGGDDWWRETCVI